MPVWRPVMRAARMGLVMLLAAVSLPKFGHARFDPLDPLGEVRKKHVRVSIEVAPGDWGGASLTDIEVVLGSVAREFLDQVRIPGADLKLRVIPRAGSPRVLYERGPEGQYVIQLTARDQRWFQYAYQFAHELCHVASNFDHKIVIGDQVAQHNQWFEEALCETAALFTLKRLGVAWASNPPQRNWVGYGESFTSYAEHLLSEPHRQLVTGESLRDWYAEHRASLGDNPYLRQENEAVASALLPLLEAHPQYWQSIAYLNADSASAARPFAEYLADWYRASPDKALPRTILQYFGFDPAGHETPRADGPAQPVAAGALPGDNAANGPAGN